MGNDEGESDDDLEMLDESLTKCGDVNKIIKGRYTYTYDSSKGMSTVHHVTVSRSRVKRLMFRVQGRFVLTCFILAVLNKSLAAVFLSFAIAGLFLRFLLRNQVERASVVIFPDFGVQLETLYTSGETVRRFVQIGKILKPVLNECVTPVTCYWNLSLIVRGREEVLPVFKELYPPLSMLVPIWKALCSTTVNV